ncbi:MAG: alpha-glucosidase [Candidatus Izemoplasmatales bacterium]
MKRAWYREGAVYQVYPRSFKDADGDGVGDLKGIVEKIPHIAELGCDIVWLSPVYATPNDDNGYDISDYRAINPEFGTMADMDELIARLHARGIRLVMDLVVNHTSDEHPWFQRSVRKEPGWEDFYHWSPERKNWTSFFGGPAWTYHEERKEWYLHLFTKKQPDLNWENPRVREEVKGILEFWLAKGVDGFRCDVINLISKAPGLPNGKPALILRGREHYMNGPKIHEYLGWLRDEVFSKHDCFTVGETAFVDPKTALSYVAEDRRELDMLFQFEHMGADSYGGIKWFVKRFRPTNLKKPLSKWQRGLSGKGWNTLYLENHDQARSIDRFADPERRYASATMLATMLYFQQGTPFVYQGQELGMTNAGFTELDQYRDVESKNIYRMARRMFLYSHRKAMRMLAHSSRDNARTPMQWDASEHAGFTAGTPWIGVNPNHATVNAETEKNDPDSIFRYYQKILSLRKKYDIIVYGDYRDLAFRNPRLYAYERRLDGDSLVVVCNAVGKPVPFRVGINLYGYELILGNVKAPADGVLEPFEARVYLKRSPT